MAKWIGTVTYVTITLLMAVAIYVDAKRLKKNNAKINPSRWGIAAFLVV